MSGGELPTQKKFLASLSSIDEIGSLIEKIEEMKAYFFMYLNITRVN